MRTTLSLVLALVLAILAPAAPAAAQTRLDLRCVYLLELHNPSLSREQEDARCTVTSTTLSHTGVGVASRNPSPASDALSGHWSREQGNVFWSYIYEAWYHKVCIPLLFQPPCAHWVWNVDSVSCVKQFTAIISLTFTRCGWWDVGNYLRVGAIVELAYWMPIASFTETYHGYFVLPDDGAPGFDEGNGQ